MEFKLHRTCLLAAGLLLTCVAQASAARADLGMMLTDVDIRFNRAADALMEQLTLTLEVCNNAAKSVCHYRVNDRLAIIATAPGPGRNLEQLVGIYVSKSGGNRREAVLLNELLIAMISPDLTAKERVGMVDGLINQISLVKTATAKHGRIRYRLDATHDKSLFLYVDAGM